MLLCCYVRWVGSFTLGYALVVDVRAMSERRSVERRPPDLYGSDNDPKL